CGAPGGIAFAHVHGMDVWEFFGKTPDEQEGFDAAMSEFTVLFNPPVVKGYDFSRFGTLVDVGGGHGELLAVISKANPKLRGTVYDQPHVAEGASRRFEKEGLSDRLRAQGGNFF